jgi:predicted DCC family thiol-disulfide oxidoreductase YuxK
MAPQALPEHVNPHDAVLFYDGLCGFCDGSVRWMLRRTHANDRNHRLYFAPQQSALAHSIFARYGVERQIPDSTLLLLIHPRTSQERLLMQSDAVMQAYILLGGPWRIAASVLGITPRPLRDAIYRLIARNRHEIAGKLTECRIPTPVERSRFLGL